jgi:hypothetical protein
MKNVSEMGVASSAKDAIALHVGDGIFQVVDIFRKSWLAETAPSVSKVVFVFGMEEGEGAPRAFIGAASLLIEIASAISGFRIENFFCAAEKKGEAYKWIEFQNHNLAYSGKGL